MPLISASLQMTDSSMSCLLSFLKLNYLSSCCKYIGSFSSLQAFFDFLLYSIRAFSRFELPRLARLFALSSWLWDYSYCPRRYGDGAITTGLSCCLSPYPTSINLSLSYCTTGIRFSGCFPCYLLDWKESSRLLLSFPALICWWAKSCMLLLVISWTDSGLDISFWLLPPWLDFLLKYKLRFLQYN